MNPTLASLSAVALLVACAAPSQKAWFHSSGSSDSQRFHADDGTCTGLAYRSVATPPSTQSGSTTTFSGQTSTGTTFQGEARTAPANQLFGAAAGFQAYDTQNRYEQAVRSIHRGCMAERGWTLRSK